MNIPVPREMRVAPGLDPAFVPTSIASRQALLINPFYPKDRHASFAKHVLTPSLALTSIAAATPEAWQVRCWDENLLQGPHGRTARQSDRFDALPLQVRQQPQHIRHRQPPLLIA